MASYHRPFAPVSGPPSLRGPQPPPPPPPGPPQPQQPSEAFSHAEALAIASDPYTFRNMYRGQLSGLTFNSKPLITHLTILAHEHVYRMSNVIVQAIVDHIHQSSPQYRLPALYVMDSICKNIGAPYPAAFSTYVEGVFLETYRLVEGSVKVRLEELLGTWRNSGPRGTELFGPGPQTAIEQSLFGREGMMGASPSRGAFSGPLPPPQPPAPRQPASFAPPAALPGHPPRGPPGPPPAPPAHTAPYSRSAPSITPQPPVFPAPAPMPASAYSLPSTSSAPVPAPTAPAATSVGPVPDLFQSLKAAGLIGGSADALSSLLQTTGLPQVSAKRPEPDSDYEMAIMSLDIKLTNVGIQQEYSQAVSLIYGSLPQQCRQCAARFPVDQKGKARMEDHLDWHFRHNRRARESLVRGQSRSWLIKDGDWFCGGEDDGGNAHGSGHDRENDVEAQAAKKKAEHARSFVIVPSDPDKAAKPCPICKEAFKSEWSEDEEEWLWRNAVEVDGTVYHASCHDSARTLSEAVGTTPPRQTKSRSSTPQMATLTLHSDPVTRIKAEERGATPTTSASGSSSSMATTSSSLGKRKDSPVVKEEVEGNETDAMRLKRVAS